MIGVSLRQIFLTGFFLFFCLGPSLTGDLLGANKKRIQLNVKERKRKKKKTQKATYQARRSALVAVKVEKRLSSSINKVTKSLNRTASSLPKNSAKRLQILQRVLNLYMENATYTRNAEERAYDVRWQNWDRRGRKGREPKLTSKKSFGMWKKVISQSTRINREYPKNAKADIVLYNKAIGLQYIGREKEAARILSQLVERFKGSNVAGDAYASLGDFYFDSNSFRSAQNSYKKATNYRQSSRYLWSVFKLGWCAFNLNQYQRSKQLWKRVVRESRAKGSKGVQLKDEALRDLVYAFAELREVDAAIAYYRANGGKKFIGPFLTLLGEILADQGNFKSAISVYKRFQRVARMAPEAPNAQKEIINLYYLTGKLPIVWKELSRFRSMYGPGSAWSRANKDIAKETQEIIKDQIIYYASLTHQKAIKDGKRRLNKEAKKGYLLFLKSYPKSKEVPGVMYLIADIEYFLKNFSQAGSYYYKIAALGKKKALRYNPVTKKFDRIHRVSSEDMVRSYVKAFEPRFKVLKKRKPSFKKPLPISKEASDYIKACGNYVKWYPKDKKRVKSCDVSIATIYYKSGIKGKAIKALKTVAIKYPGTKEGSNAVDLTIPMLDGNKAQLAAATKFLSIPAYAKGKLGAKLRDLIRGSEKENIGKEKDLMKRAKKYQAQAEKYPKDPDVVKLWNNAAVSYMDAGAISLALAAHGKIVKLFPKKPQAQTSLLIISRIQEKLLQFEAASSSFLAFYRKYPKQKEADVALQKACELLAALESAKAAGVCMRLAVKYPDIAVGFIERLIDGAYKSKQYSKMKKLITQNYLGKFRLTPNQQVVAWKKVYDSGSKKSAQGKMIGIWQANRAAIDGEALRAIGDFYLVQANVQLPKFLKLKLRGGNVENLQRSIEAKAQALGVIEQAFNNVLSLKDAHSGVAAYYQQGFAYENFANAMANPPAIKGAAKADVVAQLSKEIVGLRTTAFKLYNKASETVTKYSVYSKWSVKTIDGLARVKEKRFKFFDFVVPGDFVGIEAPINWVEKLKDD